MHIPGMCGLPARISRPVVLGLAAVATLTAVANAGEALAPFTEEAQQRGIDYLPNHGQSWGDGIAFADLDDDGDPDIIAIGRSDGTMGIYENDGTGYFTDRYPTSGIGLIPKYSGVTACDYDRDGDLDIFISRQDTSDVLLRNDGNFTFTDVTVEAGLGDTGEGAGSGWGDFDGDGWLDLYATTHDFAQPNRLYRNNGDGTFTDVAPELGVSAIDQHTFQGSFFDYDRDGDPDLYLTNSYGQHCEDFPNRNLLFENVGGVFIDVTEEANALACVDSMCIGLGDFDNNLYPDVYVTDNNLPGNALLMNDGPDEFGQCVYVDDAESWGVESFASSWGSVFFDFDHDGWMDLYVCNMAMPNRLYRHEGAPACVDLGPALGVAETGGNSFGCAVADVDGDGDLDLLNCDRQAKVRLFINHEGTNRNWVKYDVIGEGANRWAANATVTTRTGQTWRYREVVIGSNYKSQNELILHFGVRDAPIVNETVVRWRSGTSRTITALATNTLWTIYPPDKLGDRDQDGDRDVDDFNGFVACFTDDIPGTIEPGCEMMDFDGDADVDLDDLDEFLVMYEGPQEDCNDNGILDLLEILDGSAPDVNGNGILDACDDIVGDLNDDLFVDGADLVILLQAWGAVKSSADLDGSGRVDFGDLVMLLTNWT